MRESLFAAILIPLVALLAAGSAAQQPPPASAVAEELIAQEKIRSAVERAFTLYRRPAESGAEKNDNFVRAVDDLVREGPAVVPFLAAELEQALKESFFLCAYALGRLGTPEAEAALRRAVEKAEQEPGDYALTRKSWAVYGLGLMGAGDAIELLYNGRHTTGALPMCRDTTVTEVVALQTWPQCVPTLLELVDRFAGDPTLRAKRTNVLRALWRVADPASVPKLIEVMKEDDVRMRQEAAHALAYIRTPRALEAALAALGDPDPIVRQVVAISLLRAQADFDPNLVSQRLEVEDAPRAREALYELLVDKLGLRALDLMQEQWDNAPSADRTGILRALERIPVPETLPLLDRGLRDPDVSVVIRAVATLGAVGGDAAVKQLRLAVHSPSWNVARAAVERLVALGATAAAPSVADRLLKVELHDVVRQVEKRHQPQLLADALVSLEYTRVIDGLKKATAKQTDPVLIESLQSSIAQLEALRANGDKLERWIEAVGSERREIRVVAFRRLAAIGGDKAVETLISAFGRVESDEGVEILRLLGDMRAAPVPALLERVLLGPEFDAVDRLALRDMAAWSARRIGGARMSEALRAAVERRDGRDARVLIYLLALDGKRALPVLERYRLPRMRYLLWSRGNEIALLDRIARRIEAGRSIAEFDVPPDSLEFR